MTSSAKRVRTFPHVVCVDDGSSDDGADQAAAAGAVVVRHPVNLGQGAALQTGFEYAAERARPCSGSSPSTPTDSTRSTTSSSCSPRPAREDLDVVFGSRFLDDRTEAGFLKGVVLKLAVGYTNLTTRTRLTDAHNGLRVMSRDVVARVEITQNRMAHASELVHQIGHLGIRYGESPVHILYTDYSRSKGQSLWNAVNILADLILR